MSTTGNNQNRTLYIPDAYRADDSEENKVIYALGLIGEGTAGDIGIKISEIDQSIEPGGFGAMAEHVLRQLYEEELIGGKLKDDVMHYWINQ